MISGDRFRVERRWRPRHTAGFGRENSKGESPSAQCPGGSLQNPPSSCRSYLRAITFMFSLLAVAVVLEAPALAAQGDCSQPISNGTTPNTSDCSFILRAAVGVKTCALCVCDVN